MEFGDWISDARNIVFLVIALMMFVSAVRVVSSPNLVHAALMLVLTLAGAAALFVMLGAEFVAWTLVLVYIGAVIVLFLFGIMITRAPTGRDPVRLDHEPRIRQGSQTDPDEPAARRVELRISQNELGQLTGTSRESINKHLQRWRKKGWVALGRNRVMIRNCEALQELVDTELEG